MVGAVGVWWVQECVQVQRQSELVWCVQLNEPEECAASCGQGLTGSV